MDVDAVGLRSRDRFLRAGNKLADEAASLAAARNWTMPAKSDPRTDFWDAQSALIRRRARRALVDSSLADPTRSSTEPGPERARRGTALDRA